MKFGVMIQQFKLNILILLWIDIHCSKGKNCFYSLCQKKNFDSGMHLDDHEQIWFKVGVIIDIAKLYSFTVG